MGLPNPNTFSPLPEGEVKRYEHIDHSPLPHYFNHMQLDSLYKPLTVLQGIGPKYRALLKNLIKGDRLIDLAFHMPNYYVERKILKQLLHVPFDTPIIAKVTVEAHKPPRKYSGAYEIVVSDGTSYLSVMYFHAKGDYLQKLYPIGHEIAIAGKVDSYGGKKQMMHPDYVLPATQIANIPLIEPVYPLCAGITNKTMMSAIKGVRQFIPDTSEWLPQELIQKNHWPRFGQALLGAHMLDRSVDHEKARERLAFDELYAHQISLRLARNQTQINTAPRIAAELNLVSKAKTHLPFALTEDQNQVLHEIYTDMRSGKPMRRLLQGDVGCGKTVVAFLSMLALKEAGHQAAIMAPTDILARQHYAFMKPFEETLGIKVELLTGREKGKARKEILERLATGEINLAIGTHALFEDPVIFHKLGLVIIDEQHRYGVEQRYKLLAKGEAPHLLVMTATPIPRTLHMAFYGDLDLSMIKHKPGSRKPIDTRIISLERLHEVINSLAKQIDKGEQIYWICPLVAESEKLDLAAAEDRYTFLKAVFGEKVGLIHGRLDNAQKDQVLEDFKEGKVQILVSTTVVEVGIHVEKATTMIIEHAERFGLSQLHQLRGRVGRSDLSSFCLLLYATPINPIAQRRLEVMRETNDGFVIAEEDLNLRGSGTILGRAQSGAGDFKIAEFPQDFSLLSAAHQLVQQKGQSEPPHELLQLFEMEGAMPLIQAG